jgi:hypothetical protein
MSIGIWTSVAGSTKLNTFGDPLLRTLADRTRSITVTTGPHLRFVNMGCEPVFLVPTPVPTTDIDALTRGIPVPAESDVVIAAAAGTYTLYSPYESLSLLTTEGTLS